MEVYQFSQSSSLIRALVCYPMYFKIEDINNEYYNKIDYELLFNQYNNYINTLINNGVKLNFIDVKKECSAQVFTQDIGFVIEDMFFVSKMTRKCRFKEIEMLKDFLMKNQIRYYEMENNIEGGDLIHYGDTIFVGVSSRTSIEGIEELKNVLLDMQIEKDVVPIHFDNKKIHLDLVFNILDQGEAIVSDYVYDKDKDKLKNYFDKIHYISKEDADNYAANIVYIGKRKVLTSFEGLEDLLTPEGYEIVYIDYSEVSKAGGSLGCSIMFLETE